MQGRSDGQRDLLDVESIAGHLLKPGSVFSFLAEHRRVLFPDELFADLFPSGRGRPSVPAEMVAAVIVLQALHGLSDAEAVDELTFDLRWKAACGLPVTAAGFHPTTLTYWRRRLAASERPDRIFEVVREVIAQTGVLKGKTRRALDSTVLDDAVATQDTVIQLIAAIRAVRRIVPGAAEIVAQRCSAHDYDDPGKPAIAWNDQAAREQLIDALVRDALAVLAAFQNAQPEDDKAADALALLALIAGQDVELVDEGADPPRWRIAQRVAPDRVISVVDPEARHAHKTVHRRQDGFKAHIAIEPDTGLITDCALTKASGPDSHEASVGLALLDAETAPVTVLADSAYGSGEFRAALAGHGHLDLVKAAPTRSAVPGGFTVDDFIVEHAAGTATCPNGLTRTISRTGTATFGAACRSCALRSRCTTSPHGKKLLVRQHDRLQRQARADRLDPAWQDEYRQHRPMVERSIAWLTRGNRKVRYHGVTKNDHWLHHRTAALNLRRLITLGLDRQAGQWALVV